MRSIKYALKPYSALLVTSYCTLRRKDSLYALVRRFYVSRKGGTGGGGWVGDMHMVAARLGCTSAMLGPCGPTLALAAWTGLENATLHLVGGSFLAGKAA